MSKRTIAMYQRVALNRDVCFHAGRLSLGVIGGGDKEGYTHAAAVLSSVLQVLAQHAHDKPLTHDDIQSAADAALKELDVEEGRTPMGNLVYRYKQKA